MIEPERQSPERLATIRSLFPQFEAALLDKQSLTVPNQYRIVAALRDTLAHIAFLEAEHTRLSNVIDPEVLSCSDDENS